MRLARRIVFTLSLLCCILPDAAGRELPASTRRRIDALMEEGLTKEYYPGAQLVIGGRDGILYEKYVGWIDQGRTSRVTADNVYDLASVTKVVATTFAMMDLYGKGEIDLNRRVGDYIDTYGDSEVSQITITQLLTHTSGLPFFAIYPMVFKNADGGTLTKTRPDEELYPTQVDKNCYMCANPQADPRFVSRTKKADWRQAGDSTWVNPAIDTMITSRVISSYKEELVGTYRYSDTNFHILRQIVEAVSGTTLDSYVNGLYDRLGMYQTGYRPAEWAEKSKIAPTEYDYLMQRGMIRGFPHDEFAAVSAGGVNGHAGLFSTARDLALFCRMMLDRGNLDGKVLERNAVDIFTSSPLSPKDIWRGLGFDKRNPEKSLGNGFGHTGYTGTMIWMDPQRDIFMVFLCNRVHPTRINTELSSSSMRTVIWETLSRAME